jgi:MFS family permease
MLATLPGRTQGLALVTEPLLADLGLERLTYAHLNLVATLVGALFCLPSGWAIDRFGLRGVTTAVVLALGLSVGILGRVTVGLVPLFLLLLASRALGQSALSVCSITTVARWFPGRAGFAMGVYSVLLSVGFAVAFGVIGWSVRESGWRAAWLQVAFALVLVITPIVALLHREPRSGRRGASPASGGEAAPAREAAGQTRVEGGADLTLPQALRTGAFWLFAGGAAAFNLVSSGLGLFNEAVLAERGFSQRTFHGFLAASALLALGGQFLGGWLTRRWRHQAIMSVALLLYVAGLAGLAMTRQFWQLAGVAVLLGVAGGMIMVIFFAVWGDLFGQRQLGRIQGAAQMVTVVSSGLGPVVFAAGVARSGSYAPVLLVLAGVGLLLAAAAPFVKRPRGSEHRL